MKRREIIWKFIKFRFWHPQAGWDRVLLCYFWGGLALVPAILGHIFFKELGMAIGGLVGVVGLYKILDQYDESSPAFKSLWQ